MRNRLTLAFALGLLLAVVLALPAAAQEAEPGKLVLGGTYTLESGERLQGSLGVAGGSAILEEGSVVDGDVLVAGGDLRASGMIAGDIAVFGGVVQLMDTAVVTGDIVTFGGTLRRSSGAQVYGSVREGVELSFRGWRGVELVPPISSDQPFPPPETTPSQWLLLQFWRFVRNLGLTLAFGALALVVSVIWPAGTKRIGGAVLAQPALALLIGLLTWVLGAVLVILLAITLCLLPVALLLAVVLVLAALLSWIVVGWVLGSKLLSVLKLRNPSTVLEATSGTVLLVLTYFLLSLLPCVDFVFGLLVASLGLGAIVLTRAGTRPHPTKGDRPGPYPVPALPPASGPAEATQVVPSEPGTSVDVEPSQAGVRSAQDLDLPPGAEAMAEDMGGKESSLRGSAGQPTPKPAEDDLLQEGPDKPSL